MFPRIIGNFILFTLLKGVEQTFGTSLPSLWLLSAALRHPLSVSSGTLV